jgi:hypothetical protein
LKRAIAFGLLFGLAFTAALQTSCTDQKKSVRLRFKFEPGEVSVHQMDSKRMWKVMEKDSVVREGTTEVTASYTEEVIRVLEDSTAEVLQTDDWTAIERMTNDTTPPDTSAGSRSVTLYVKPNGQIVDFELPPDEDVMSEQYLRTFYEQAATRLPGGLVTQGETWTHTTQVVIDTEPVTATTTYTLKSFARDRGYDCVVIEYDGNLVIPVQPKESDSVKYVGLDKIQVNGMMYFAYREGLIISARERWLMDRRRGKPVDGKIKEMVYEIEMDVDYQLDKLIQPQQ